MIEHELKFALTPSMVAEFEQRATIGLARPSARLWSRYFDTATGDLMKAAVSLRVRRTHEGYVQTIKAPGSGPFERFEWEAQVAGEHPEFDALPPPGHAAGALTRECFDLLAPLFETDFERQVRLVRPQPGVRLELACDRGEIRAGGRSERIAEVELERKEGSAAAFYHYAMQWARLHQAQLLLPSKSLRGLQLAGRRRDQPEPVDSRPSSPPADLPVALAARAVLGGHVGHLLDNIGPVLSGHDPEGPRQLHAALRRFRSAIRFFGLRSSRSRALDLQASNFQAGAGRDDPRGDDVQGDPRRDGPRRDDPGPDDSGGEDRGGDDGRGSAARGGAGTSATWRRLDLQAQALGHATAFVRRADLLEAGLLAGLQASFPDDPAVRLLCRSLAIERERERARLRAVVMSSDMAIFVIEALAAIESLPSERWGEDRFADLAAARLPALVRRLRRRTRRGGTDEHRPALQIATRDLSDALDTCRELRSTAMPIDEAVAALSQWQSSLGLERQLAFVQGIAARAVTASAASRQPAEVRARAAALIDGYCACASADRAQGKLRQSILAMSQRLLREPDRQRAGSGRGNRQAPMPDEQSPPAPAAQPAASLRDPPAATHAGTTSAVEGDGRSRLSSG